MCDAFHLPVVNFVDNPGFLIGVEAGKRGTIRRGVRALAAVYQATVPQRSPFLTAEGFGVEEIIDPRDTRPLLVEWARRAYELVDAELGEKTRSLRP